MSCSSFDIYTFDTYIFSLEERTNQNKQTNSFNQSPIFKSVFWVHKMSRYSKKGEMHRKISLKNIRRRKKKVKVNYHTAYSANWSSHFNGHNTLKLEKKREGSVYK